MNFWNYVIIITFGSQSDSLRDPNKEFRKTSALSAYVAGDLVQKLKHQPTRIRKVFVLQGHLSQQKPTSLA